MAIAVGKRKRDEEDDNEDGVDLKARFQAAFEARFKPLAKTSSPALPKVERIDQAASVIEEEDEDEDESEDSEWDGLSDEGDALVIVDHGSAKITDDEALRRQEMKSSKPPTPAQKAVLVAKVKMADADEDKTESSNLKHDIALQRLLKESHLLDPSNSSGASMVPEGKSRLQALDMRLKDLGAKQSILEQVNMPIAHRKGIQAKATSRATNRRKDAAENGVILERFKAAPKVEERRERGNDGPAVGKFKNGTLKLSARDVKAIEGPKSRTGGKGRR